MIYICIPVFNRLPYTIECIESILLQKDIDINVEIVICDDASTDGTFEYIMEKYPFVKVIKGKGNLWWTGGINECIKYVLNIANSKDYVFTLNNDTELFDDTLFQLLQFANRHPRTIVSGVNVFYSNLNQIEVTAFIKSGKFPFPEYHRPLHQWGSNIDLIKKPFEEVSSLSGKGVLIPIEIFHEIGLYNFEKLPHYHADTEFIRRALKSGYKAFINYKARIKSHQDLSGIGQINNAPSIKDFMKSFFLLKSSNHLKTHYSRAKLVYSRNWFFYFIFNIAFLVYSFFVRYFRYQITIFKTFFLNLINLVSFKTSSL